MNAIQKAINDLKRGKIIIVTDDRSRENEGDLVMVAEKATPNAINFMITHGRGLVCLALTNKLAKKLKLAQMVKQNTSRFHTNFTVSIDAKRGTTTGISAHDRARTILAAVNPKAKPGDLRRPGHIFPLIADGMGLLERNGHTEAAVALADLAGLSPAGVLCEVLSPTGRAMKGKELAAFAKKFKLTMISIAEIIAYLKKQ